MGGKGGKELTDFGLYVVEFALDGCEVFVVDGGFFESGGHGCSCEGEVLGHMRKRVGGNKVVFVFRGADRKKLEVGDTKDSFASRLNRYSTVQ